MQFEEVMISDLSTGYELEYITEDTEEDGIAAKNVPVSSAINVNNTEKSPVKKKIPIIRKPGEIVTPVTVRPSGNVKVSPSISNLSTSRALTVRSKVEWKKVEPQLSKRPLTPAPRVVVANEETTVHPESDDVEQEHETFDHEYAEPAAINVKNPQTQADRIEKKLDMILEKLNQHDATFTEIKCNIKDLRVGLKNSVNDLKELPRGTSDANNGPPPKRKRLVTFPVTDDNYLLRLEDLLQVDDNIRDEVSIIFKEAPTTSVYEFLRKNVYALFENCSKYTWTGKSSNAIPKGSSSNVASKMALVDHLITCTWETFPHLSRQSIEMDFRRALGNFNDTVYIKRKKRMAMRVQNEFDTNSETDLL
ncbi:uncharacterized protein LOC135707739 [Ochlerotatus camptorhynchus]|uniref:uncharacterized protein LOC135707739 n=1 Tax=Ochlerotatus camptorhynchus TaxID=644619 RepID=UPI0031E052DA